MNDQYVLLWSAARNSVRVETVVRMLESNRAAYRDGRASDYIALVIGSCALIDTTVLNCQGTLVRREAERAASAGEPAAEYAATAGAPT